ncbi:hypothetical protein Q5752_002174 [Cryptotrichosporon argae]
MSLRSVTRVLRTAPLRPAAARSAAPVGRRFASSSTNPKSNDLPWAAGSAVIFGSLGAYILTSGGKPHDAHAAHKTVGGKNHPTPEEKGEDEGPKVKEKTGFTEDGGYERVETKEPVEGGTSEGQGSPKGVDEKASVDRAVANDAPLVSANKGKADKSEGDESKGDESKGDAAEGDDEGCKAEDIPEEEIKKAIERGEKTDAPRVAMAEEAQGHQTQAELDK